MRIHPESQFGRPPRSLTDPKPATLLTRIVIRTTRIALLVGRRALRRSAMSLVTASAALRRHRCGPSAPSHPSRTRGGGLAHLWKAALVAGSLVATSASAQGTADGAAATLRTGETTQDIVT